MYFSYILSEPIFQQMDFCTCCPNPFSINVFFDTCCSNPLPNSHRLIDSGNRWTQKSNDVSSTSRSYDVSSTGFSLWRFWFMLGQEGGRDQRGTTQKTVRWLVADSYRVSLSLLLYIYAYVHIIQAWTRAYPCSEHGWTKPGGQSDTRLEHSVFEQFFSRLFVRVSLRRAVERWLEFSRFSRLLSFMWGSQPRRARVFSFVRRVFTFLVFSASAGSSFLKFCRCV